MLPDRTPIDDATQNRRTLTAVALAVAIAFAFSASLPAALIPAAMQSLLFFGAMGAVLLALIRRDDARAPRLNGWDQALMLIFLSMAAGFFVDHEAVRQQLAALQAAKGMVPPAS